MADIDEYLLSAKYCLLASSALLHSPVMLLRGTQSRGAVWEWWAGLCHVVQRKGERNLENCGRKRQGHGEPRRVSEPGRDHLQEDGWAGTLGVCEGESRLLGGPCHSQVKGDKALAACPEGRHVEESQWGEN